MFKLFIRLICLSIISLIAFLIISLYSGGEKFRWFGKKVEEKTETIGRTADSIKDKGEKAIKGIEKVKEKIKDLTGKE